MQWNGIFWACDAMWLVERLDYDLKVVVPYKDLKAISDLYNINLKYYFEY